MKKLYMNGSKKAPELKDLDSITVDTDLDSEKRLDKTLKILDQIKEVWSEIIEEKKVLKSRIEDKFKKVKLKNDKVNAQFSQGKLKLSKLISSPEEELNKISKLENKVILLLDY